MKFDNLHVIYISVISIIIIYFIYTWCHGKANIASIHAMNLDKDKKRWNTLMNYASKANLSIERWPATYGKDIPYESFRELGVGHAMIRPNRHDKKREHLVNLGVVGCFLSTRNLLRHLSSKSFSGSAGHLILDDDVIIPADFLSQWESIRTRVPSNWDIIYLGLWNITGKDVAPGIKKLRSAKRSEEAPNVGTFAYIVRHGAIQTKILPWLRYMIDAIDEQYVMKFDEWNVYGLKVNIINPNIGESSINEINT